MLEQCYKGRVAGPLKPSRFARSKVSAGLLMYGIRGGQIEVLLVHLGGPFWMKKDEGAWFLAKGEVLPGEDYLGAARREFEEETSLDPPDGAEFFVALGSVRQKSGKTIHAWAFEGDCDPASLKSNAFMLEWPPRSGREREFPEVDRYGWFAVDKARRKIHSGELPFIDRLIEQIEAAGKMPPNAGRTPSKP